MRTLLTIPLLVALAPGSASAQQARDGIELGPADRVAVAAVADRSAVLMHSGDQILVSASEDCARDWGQPVRVDDDPGSSAKSFDRSGIQVVGDFVFAAWLDERDGTNSVWFNWSDDAGATWAGARRIDDGTTAGLGRVVSYRMAASEAAGTPNVYFLIRVVPEPGDDDELRFVANDGASVDTFLPAVRPSATPPQAARTTAIALDVDGSFIRVAWQDDREGLEEVWFQRSSDRGASWESSDLQLTTANDQDGQSTAPVRIDSAGAVVAVVWEERDPAPSAPEIRAAVSNDGGATFGAERRVGDYPGGTNATTPDVSVFDDGTLAAVWQDDRSGTTAVYASTSTDGGSTWGVDALLSPSGGTFARVFATGDVASACWVSGVGKAQTAFTVDTGASWTTKLASDAALVTDTAAALDPSAGNLGTSPNVVQAWVLVDDVPTAFVGGYALCGPATVTNRSAVPNPDSYAALPPTLGGSFDATVDLTTTGHPLAAIVAYEAAANLTLPNGYVLLVDVASPLGELFGQGAASGPMASFSIPVPNDPCLCEFDLYSQAVHFGGGMPFVLSNAQDAVVNSY